MSGGMETPGPGVEKGNDSEQRMDLQGLLCPLPVLKARKRLEAMKSGEVLEVLADDPMAAIDMPHFCQEHGHALLSQEKQGTTWRFAIRRR
jgi:tRNA 2-thiouridine synthesizing protein A